MVSRRCRIQARPNVAIGKKRSKPPLQRPISPAKSPSDYLSLPPSPIQQAAPTPEEKNLSEIEISSSAPVESEQDQPESIIVESIPDELIEAGTSAAIAGPSFAADYTVKLVSPPVSPQFTHKSHSNSPVKFPIPYSPLKSPVSTVSSVILPGNDQLFAQHERTTSAASCYQLSPTKSDYQPKVRKKFTGEEPLDPKTMTMQDLIFWNPKNEKKLHDEQRKKKKDMVADLESAQKKDAEIEKKKVSKPAFAAPRVKIAEDGSLVIDESSLTITNENDSSVWETVEEDRTNKKLNSMSFRKRPFSRGNPWSELETDLFYDILRATGPDFGLMHEFFPSRTRLELKAKYNREERFNWTRLNQALAVPTLLTDALYSHANEIIDRIKEEEIKKKELKSSKKNGAFSDTMSEVAAVEWNEEEADLEAEAKDAILRLLEEDKEQPSSSSQNKHRKEKTAARKKMKDALLNEVAEEAALRLREKKYERRKNELKEICDKALSKLDKDFPKFELLIDENADGVTVESNVGSKRPPIVRIPLGTIAKVLPVDGQHPQRVFFECSAKQGITSRHYVIQHQMGPGEPSTGYLHLFGNVTP